MADKQGHKAELDREGIPLSDSSKAELDKDGIPLDSKKQKKTVESQQPAIAPSTQDKASNKKSKLPIVLIGVGAVVIILAIVLFLTTGSEPEPQPVIQQPQKTSTFSDDGEIILDPFMVTFDPLDRDQSGVLIAQISLEVDPRSAANVRSQTFYIRGLILERLSTNAPVYSKKELADLIEQDLSKFKIKNVAFLRYDLR